MNKAWNERLQQWCRFNEWERAQAPVTGDIRQLGEVLDLYRKLYPHGSDSVRRLNSKIEGLHRLRQALMKVPLHT
jgi:hypothetical protein